jgi:hypothetical protein
MSNSWSHGFLIVQSTMDLVETDLIALQDLKLELGITDTSDDAALQARISRLSRQFAEYCNRIFALIEVEETFQFKGYGRAYPCAGPNPIPLVLTQYPVTEITALTREDEAIDAADYDLDAARGLLWPRSGTWSGRIVATYSGGYDLPDGAPAGLQGAVIEAVHQRGTSSGRDPSIREVQHGDTRISYATSSSSSSGDLSGPVADMLRPYRRLHVA